MRVTLEDGRQRDFDLLVGADGIWSRIRKSLVGETQVRRALPQITPATRQITPAALPCSCWIRSLINVTGSRPPAAPSRAAAAHLPARPSPPPSSTPPSKLGNQQVNYSGYTCYTGISDFTPPDIEIVGYRVFLGNGQYFVSSDVGGGKMQWCV